MKKIILTFILILCFGLSSANAALAAQIVDVSPIIVQPYEPQELTQQMLNRDRQNRDEEIAIQGLIEENNKLAQDTLARQKDEGLKKINQAMLSYRNALLSRDRARIMANSERRSSRYGDLIALTEDADAMTVHHDLESKSGLLAEKYQMLTDLKDEITALNEKLKGEGKVAQEQQDKIQMLVQRLGEMDQKISHFDEIIAQKDQQIAQLKNKMQQQGLALKAKDESIRWLNQVVAVAKNKAEYYKLTSRQDQLSIQQVQKEAQQIKDDFAQRLALQLSRKQAQSDTLRRQLADQQNKVDLLKQELDSKNAQSDQMTLMIQEYQRKLESKDNATNEQWGQLLSSKNYQAQMEKQIADLNARLQEKEAQVVKIKKDMYDLQELTGVKTKDIQAQDLSLSMIQQKMMDEKIKEIKTLRTALALARQQLAGMPSSDEIDFLRTGLNKATAQLKQKDAMFSQTKASADEYEKEFKAQSQEFQSVKEQLQSAYEEINHKNKDLKYKDMAIIRLKERAAMSNTYENNAVALQAQLRSANLQIKDLQGQLNQLSALSKGDRLREKLKQALDEIDEQGRVVNILVRKLQECGKSVDLTQYFAK